MTRHDMADCHLHDDEIAIILDRAPSHPEPDRFTSDDLLRAVAVGFIVAGAVLFVALFLL